MNVTPKTIDAVQEMVDESFKMTAKIDRMQSILSVKFAMNNTSDLIHHGMAHAYSGKFGDDIASTIEKYNIDIKYGDIQREETDYESIEVILSELMDSTIDYQNKLNMCAKIAFDEMDLHVYTDLVEIIKEHNKIVSQAILLKDKTLLYKGNYASYDAHIKSYFWNLG